MDAMIRIFHKPLDFLSLILDYFAMLMPLKTITRYPVSYCNCLIQNDETTHSNNRIKRKSKRKIQDEHDDGKMLTKRFRKPTILPSYRSKGAFIVENNKEYIVCFLFTFHFRVSIILFFHLLLARSTLFNFILFYFPYL